MPDSPRPLTPDEAEAIRLVFDLATRGAPAIAETVKGWQKRLGVKADGIVGPRTRAAYDALLPPELAHLRYTPAKPEPSEGSGTEPGTEPTERFEPEGEPPGASGFTAAVIEDALTRAAVPADLARAYAADLARYAPYFGVTTRLRWGHLLAQLIAESGSFRYTAEIWGPSAQQKRYEPPSDLARRLGNTERGDGKRYRGHGLIQTTGRANHRRVTQKLRAIASALGISPAGASRSSVPDFEANPDALTERPWSVLSAFVYWSDNLLNAEADKGDHVRNVERVSRAVNRGDADSRHAAYAEAERVAAFRRVMAALPHEDAMRREL